MKDNDDHFLCRLQKLLLFACRNVNKIALIDRGKFRECDFWNSRRPLADRAARFSILELILPYRDSRVGRRLLRRLEISSASWWSTHNLFSDLATREMMTRFHFVVANSLQEMNCNRGAVKICDWNSLRQSRERENWRSFDTGGMGWDFNRFLSHDRHLLDRSCLAEYRWHEISCTHGCTCPEFRKTAIKMSRIAAPSISAKLC